MSGDEQGYYGWANWETWNANLRLTNDEGTYGLMLETVEGSAHSYEAGDRIKALVEEYAEQGYRFIPDEMTQHRIEWDEIGAGFLEVVQGEEASTDA